MENVRGRWRRAAADGGFFGMLVSVVAFCQAQFRRGEPSALAVS
jgi:hypothetical protein